MKKNLWMLGIAVVTMTSCTQNEVLDVPETKAIAFETFVDNGTRAASQVNKDNIREFYAFGYRKESSANNYSSDYVIQNVKVSSTNGTEWTYSPSAYWQTNSSYRFAGYANGITGGGQLSNASYNPDTDIVSFTNYNLTNKDLVVAISGDKVVGETITGLGIVDLSFRHMLSIIKFSFINGSSNAKLKISNLKVSNVDMTSTGTFTYDTKLVSWTIDDTRSDECTILGENEELEVNAQASNAIDHFIIPQESDGAKLSFDLEVIDSNDDLHETKSYTDIDLKISRLGSGTTEDPYKPSSTKWINQFIYNYQISIGEDLRAIVFNVQTVEGFKTDYNEDNNHENDTNTPNI